jgi:protein-L-isoaspartate(D-aspartate) O-methyltransferase
MTLEDCRRFYAEEVRYCANLSSDALVEAFGRVPRERFLGPGPWQIASGDVRATGGASGQGNNAQIDDPRHLYHNVLVVLDRARNINNGQPSGLARWIDALALRPGARVYHLGCGVGYYTAIMAEVVGPGGAVVAVEYEEDLAARAQANLAPYPNVAAHHADGAVFDPGECDAIFVNAGVTHPHPLWLDRLRDGGFLVAPFTIALTPRLGQGLMLKIARRGDTFAAEMVSQVGIYSAAGLRNAENEALLKKSLVTGALLKVKSLRRDAHDSADTCLVHADDFCLSTEPA